jgi:hypothetical protein
MCWNAKVSLNTFIYGTIAAIIVLILGQNNILAILAVYTISLIQLMEYFAWNNIDNPRNLKIISKIGLLIIGLQVLLINFIYLEGFELNIMITLLICLLIIVYLYNETNDKFYMEIGRNGHLIWHWLDLPIILVFGLLFWLYGPYKNYDKKGINISFIYILITVIISLYFYYRYKTWGSMWCYFGNIIWIYIICNSIFKLLID